MITGTISSQNEPCVSIGLPSGKRVKKVRAVVDTGFNGYVALPGGLLVGPAWQLIGSEKYEVATGALEVFDVYLGKIRWNKKWVPVYALVTRSKDVLIGTKLLQHSVLTVDFPRKKLRITATALDVVWKSIGKFSSPFTDLSTNKKHMEGYGR